MRTRLFWLSFFSSMLIATSGVHAFDFLVEPTKKLVKSTEELYQKSLEHSDAYDLHRALVIQTQATSEFLNVIQMKYENYTDRCAPYWGSISKAVIVNAYVEKEVLFEDYLDVRFLNLFSENARALRELHEVTDSMCRAVPDPDPIPSPNPDPFPGPGCQLPDPINPFCP